MDERIRVTCRRDGVYAWYLRPGTVYGGSDCPPSAAVSSLSTESALEPGTVVLAVSHSRIATSTWLLPVSANSA